MELLSVACDKVGETSTPTVDVKSSKRPRDIADKVGLESQSQSSTATTFTVRSPLLVRGSSSGVHCGTWFVEQVSQRQKILYRKLASQLAFKNRL